MKLLGPHVLTPTAPALAWAARANVVKSVADTSAIQAAPAHALRIYRWPWDEADQDRILTQTDATEVVRQIINGLAGYRHPRLYCELLNEVHRDRTEQHVILARAVVPMLHASGLRVAVPSWSTGAYDAEHWEAWRSADWAGAELISLHAYWGNEGFTQDHALRWRRFWRPGDRPVVVTEATRDKVEGGKGGWLADGLTDEECVGELVAYDAEVSTELHVWGVLGFSAGPTGQWDRWNTFNLDPLAEPLAALYVPWTPPALVPADEEEIVTATVRGIDVSNHQGLIDWDAVAAHRFPDGSRIEFAIIKFSEDDLGADDFYDTWAARNWMESRRVGLARKAYHYAQPSKSSPAESVDVLKAAVDRVGGLGLRDGVCLDIEAGQGSLHVWVAEWVGQCRLIFKQRPLFYSGLWFLEPHDILHEDLASNPLYYASYQAELPPAPAPWSRIDVWQYSANGGVSGIAGPVDMDLFYGTRDAFERLGLEPDVVVPPPKEDWEGRVLAPINQGAQQVFGLATATADDRLDATEIVRRMDALKARHSA